MLQQSPQGPHASRVCRFPGYSTLVRSKNSPRTHNMCMLGATGHRNRYTLLAFAHTDIGRLNHRLITGLPCRIDQ